MAHWTDCRKFHEYKDAENRKILVGKAGIYQFGYFYAENFLPKYVGRVLWTEKKWDFYKRFHAYKYKAHNEEIRRRIEANRRSLWFRVMIVSDPAWTESKYLLEDKKLKEQVFEWNGVVSKYRDIYEKDDWKEEFAHIYNPES